MSQVVVSRDMDQQMISTHLISMSMPSANPVPKQRSTWGEDTDPAPSPCEVLVRPGQGSELVVQIRNVSDRPTYFSLSLTGNVPLQWCQFRLHTPIHLWVRWHFIMQIHSRLDFNTPRDWEFHWFASLLYCLLSERTLLNRQQREVSLFIKNDVDFFEQRLALAPGQVNHLDFSGAVHVYSSLSMASPDAVVLDALSLPILYPPPETAIAPIPQQQLVGAEDFTVHVRPWGHYPQYLPEVFQGVDFVHRFLAIFEQTFDPDVQTLRLMWAHLDPLTAPESMLAFLSHWVGWPLEDGHNALDLKQKRRLISNALSIYRWRGTRWGLLLYLHLYTGLPLSPHDIPEEEASLKNTLVLESPEIPPYLRHIRIESDSIQGFVIGSTTLGPETVLGGGKPYHFTVRLRSRPDDPPLNQALVRKIIDQEKPAFCSYSLYIDDY